LHSSGDTLMDSLSKLKREDKILNVLKEQTHFLINENFNGYESLGVTTDLISKKLNIDRSSVSRGLNVLLRKQNVVKIHGKPVLYLDKSVIEEHFKIKISSLVMEKEGFINLIGKTNIFTEINGSKAHHKAVLPAQDKDNKTFKSSVFDSSWSLKIPIEQAKSAVLYPPYGLHTLIIGETGVGKSTFAEAMYRYAIESGAIEKDAPFIIFNCAEYAENPQLLLSQLFGHVKGAFTGADKEKAGLVEQADGGILFLDEVHRLPPEGQEMMFLLMDKGVYRRLGQSEKQKYVHLLIIAATTKDPQTTMLDTFLRRIPVVIKLPGLTERTLRERMELIYYFFEQEMTRVKVPIKVSKEVLKALMIYSCPGNVGQLKSDIQLICARAFLDYNTFKNEMLDIKLSQIPQRVRAGFLEIKDKREELNTEFNFNSIDNVLFNNIVRGKADRFEGIVNAEECKLTQDFYSTILNKWNELSAKGYSIQEIKRELDKQIEAYFQSFFNTANTGDSFHDTDNTNRFSEDDAYIIINETMAGFKDLSGISNDRRVMLSLANHINSLFSRLQNGEIIRECNSEIIKQYPIEYQIAKKLKENLESWFKITIPEAEVSYLTVFLYGLKIKRNKEYIGILVIMHGEAAAKTMVDVANTLLGVDHARAIDMPLYQEVETILERAAKEVININSGKGVLIMVDMGSLVSFPEIIKEKTGIDVRMIEMVSTPLVIEATRKSFMPDMNLDMLLDDLEKIRDRVEDKKNNNTKILESKFWIGQLEEILSRTLTFLNPHKASEILIHVLKAILSDLDKNIDDDIVTKFLFHSSCMVERVIKNNVLDYSSLNIIKEEKAYYFNIVKSNIQIVEESFDIIIPDTEIAYIVEIIDTHYITH